MASRQACHPRAPRRSIRSRSVPEDGASTLTRSSPTRGRAWACLPPPRGRGSGWGPGRVDRYVIVIGPPRNIEAVDMLDKRDFYLAVAVVVFGAAGTYLL